MVKRKTRARRSGRTNDPERTKADILAVATAEFSESGYSGGRVDEIAKRTKTSKRMIYYYFGSKDGLYRAVLMEYYSRLRSSEDALHLEDLSPMEGMRRLVEFTFDYHIAHADETRLVMVENIHRGRHLDDLPGVDLVNEAVLKHVTSLLTRGVKTGVMRPGLEAVDVYASIAALCFFNVSNRHTFSKIFNYDMTSEGALKVRRDQVVDIVLRYVAA
jgi:AcrR family transcriptional regulator